MRKTTRSVLLLALASVFVLALSVSGQTGRTSSGGRTGWERRASTATPRPLADLLAEYRSVRESTITLFAGLPQSAWLRRGMVNGYSATVRGLAFHIAGHELHHHRVVRERYLAGGS